MCASWKYHSLSTWLHVEETTINGSHQDGEQKHGCVIATLWVPQLSEPAIPASVTDEDIAWLEQLDVSSAKHIEDQLLSQNSEESSSIDSVLSIRCFLFIHQSQAKRNNSRSLGTYQVRRLRTGKPRKHALSTVMMFGSEEKQENG